MTSSPGRTGPSCCVVRLMPAAAGNLGSAAGCIAVNLDTAPAAVGTAAGSIGFGSAGLVLRRPGSSHPRSAGCS